MKKNSILEIFKILFYNQESNRQKKKHILYIYGVNRQDPSQGDNDILVRYINGLTYTFRVSIYVLLIMCCGEH